MFRRIACLHVPRWAVTRALVVGGPLLPALATTKCLKLALAQAQANDTIAGGLVGASWHFLVGLFQSSALPMLVGATALLAWLSARLVRHRHSTSIGLFLAVLMVYGGTVVNELLEGGANPWNPTVLSEPRAALLELTSLWWRDVLVAAIVIATLTVHFASTLRGPRRIQNVAVWSIVVLAYALAGLDFGYVVATGAPLTGEDVLYALADPIDALTVSGGSISVPATLALLAPLAGLALSVLLAPRVQHQDPESGPQMYRTRLGLLVWPALAVAVAAPAMTANLVSSPLARDTLLSLPAEVMALSNWRQNSVDDAAAMSSQVPLLDARPMVTARTSRTRALNVVVVMLESVRADATSVYSSDLSNTPFLADLSRESLVVDQMYAVVPRTSAAWVAILAGRYPANIEVTRRWAESAGRQPFEPSLPAFLRAQGYTSGYFSTATLHYENNADVIRALQFDKAVTREEIPAPASGAVSPFGWEDHANLEPINRWLDERSTQGSPFLLTVMTNVGHYPYIVPPGVVHRDYPSRNSMHLKYLNCIRYIDDYLRDLVDALRKRNLLENTVLIVLGDHGEEFFDHGNYGRGHGLYDEVLHIPMLIRLPQSDGRTGHIGGLR